MVGAGAVVGAVAVAVVAVVAVVGAVEGGSLRKSPSGGSGKGVGGEPVVEKISFGRF